MYAGTHIYRLLLNDLIPNTPLHTPRTKRPLISKKTNSNHLYAHNPLPDNNGSHSGSAAICPATLYANCRREKRLPICIGGTRAPYVSPGKAGCDALHLPGTGAILHFATPLYRKQPLHFFSLVLRRVCNK